MGGVLVLPTKDHKQLPPMTGRTFLCTSHIESCSQMVRLNRSVRAYAYRNYHRVKEIARIDPKIQLCSLG